MKQSGFLLSPAPERGHKTQDTRHTRAKQALLDGLFCFPSHNHWGEWGKEPTNYEDKMRSEQKRKKEYEIKEHGPHRLSTRHPEVNAHLVCIKYMEREREEEDEEEDEERNPDSHSLLEGRHSKKKVTAPGWVKEKPCTVTI